jgi:uncharacterized protein YndB with AHSA1/START domain
MSTTVERSIELDASPDEVWRAVSDPAELAGWLADEADLDVVPGGEGRFVEDGHVRRAVVERVDHGRSLVFRWWDEEGGEGDATRVEVTVLPTGGPTRLVVRETVVAASAVKVARRWDLRLTCLALLRLAAARV